MRWTDSIGKSSARITRTHDHRGKGRCQLRVVRAVDGSASVMNTVGHHVEKRGVTFDRIHGQGATLCTSPDRRSGREPSG